MKIIAKQNVVDSDMIEMYSEDKKYMLAIIHIDCFEGRMRERLHNGEELTLTLEIEGEA